MRIKKMERFINRPYKEDSCTVSSTFMQNVQNDIRTSLDRIRNDGEFVVCDKCERRTLKDRIIETQFVCPHCDYHYPLGAYNRIFGIVDKDSFKEFGQEVSYINRIDFPGYIIKLEEEKNKIGLSEAVVTGECVIGGIATIIAVLDSRFLMGSMGSVAGEKITRAIEVASACKKPLVIFSASGGARMQEGIFSLMQMAKTSAAISRFSNSGGLYISCLTNPTMGGVTASFATLGDITIAEPKARIGFAGPRVIEETIRCKLPDGFQRSEYLEEKGFVDKIVSRGDMRETLISLLRLHGY